ncbi:MAG: hypothetical protein QF741_02715 [Candidatus Peribacteraceae bacterium]|jgi:vacuolar-type H+-ATPase subunit E/Vma4|nr:hypothetical protein [Candidatus Peribacteraceae bacterium]MDP7454556.1 hypothetical protein [Candidatus Peribacteraceae bacterium]MDP7646399.1 hypothetical protein [Candidatus Peribacteraceae bacterium]
MALQDILTAITQQADQKITDARSVHQKSLTKIREDGERTVAERKQEIARQKEVKKAQIKAKAENAADMHVKNSLLSKKRDLLDKTYDEVVDDLVKLPDDKLEPLMLACLKSITTEGTIQPADKHTALMKKLADSDKFKMGSTVKAKGGFRFISENREQDCTLEHLVAEVLRPATELEIANSLFTAT